MDPFKDNDDELEDNDYRKGYSDGTDEGYSEGYTDGYEDGVNDNEYSPLHEPDGKDVGELGDTIRGSKDKITDLDICKTFSDLMRVEKGDIN